MKPETLLNTVARAAEYMAEQERRIEELEIYTKALVDSLKAEKDLNVDLAKRAGVAQTQAEVLKARVTEQERQLAVG